MSGGFTSADEYRIERMRREDVQEARDLGYATERASQRADGDYRPFTFSDWIRHAQRPAIGPDDVADLDAADLARAWRAHDAAEMARERYERACAERGAVFAEIVGGGWTIGRLAKALGISRSAVHQSVKAHGRREASGMAPTWEKVGA